MIQEVPQSDHDVDGENCLAKSKVPDVVDEKEEK